MTETLTLLLTLEEDKEGGIVYSECLKNLPMIFESDTSSEMMAKGMATMMATLITLRLI